MEGGIKIEFRKLIKFGDSSFVVSVPMNWIKRNSLKKGDTIYLEENGNGELVLNPKLKEHKKEIRESIINVDNKDILRIKRELVSAYLGGYNIVKLHVEDLTKNIKDIRDEVHSLMAFEIMEQSKTEMIIKDLLALEEISLNDMVRRMDIITRAMISNLKSNLENKKPQSLENLDQDVNRIYFVGLRTLVNALKDPNFASLIKLEQSQIFSYWNVIYSIEAIADVIKAISNICTGKCSGKKVDEEILILIYEIENTYLEVMKAYYNKDVELAYKLSSKKKELFTNCDKFLEKNWKHRCVPGLICELKKLIDETHNLGRRIYS